MNEHEPQSSLNKSQIQQLIANQLSRFRELAWEDDISRNSIETAPFENLPPISEILANIKRIHNAELSWEEILRYAANDLAPIPSASDRENYSANYDERYWYTGLIDYLNVMQIVQQHSVPLQRYFDFGCASGRVLRHFAAQSNLKELWGSDINARHIRWLCDFLPTTVKPIANHALPQLPIADHFFDLITAFSVFTHIDTFETCWLAELRRILAPEGLAYFTIHNEATWHSLRDQVDNPNNRLIQSMIAVNPTVVDQLAGELPSGRTVYRFTHLGPYRAQVFHSNDYIRNVWGRFFEVVDILPCHHYRQSAVILR